MRAKAEHKISTRTCVSCGTSEAKQSLVRIVRTKEGNVFYDSTGKAAGRGAYLCASDACFDKARKQRRLDRALRCSLSNEEYQSLEEAFKALCTAQEQTA